MMCPSKLGWAGLCEDKIDPHQGRLLLKEDYYYYYYYQTPFSPVAPVSQLCTIKKF